MSGLAERHARWHPQQSRRWSCWRLMQFTKPYSVFER